ncbi:Alcohol dehydrogenase zinc-binding domain protein [uncultured Pleomorphomonas sp.]|uniref:Alcohol dehydrogenase zinc-binding domain protein n=1 Tax=uncultured Pleomorphomonas sp. TaxID=442121 RepID=A0A212LF08_9HYPH|nr:NADP-dependent oxidoreductase [uncultured Pleomorphomonas sp.]SCM75979.1 Alcohol dehydrogenase zinc-binding domain protein [uncultured Pleomorphomonas sp.]
MTETIKAVQIGSYGGPGELRYVDVPKPSPREGEVLIRVHAAGLNPVDWKTRAGQGAARFFQNPFPLTLGWDVSGVVEALGKGVTEFEPGNQVFGYVRFPQPGGTHAEYVAAPAAQLVRKGSGLGHVEAAALSAAALTAWQNIFDSGALEAGQTILIHAGAGGVGHFAVQLAKWKGARVIATASASNRAFLKRLGADEVIDYRKEPFEAAVRDVDVVFDLIGGEVRERSWQTLKPGGVLVSTRSEAFSEAPFRYGVRGRFIWAQPNARQLSTIQTLVEEGHVRVEVDKVYALKNVRRAHERGASGHNRGKIVLGVRDGGDEE